MMVFSKKKLKEVCKRITVGHVGPMAEKYVLDGVPFLRSQNISPFQLQLEDIKFIPVEFHEKLRKSALHPGDVVVVRTGYPGTACVIPDSFPELNCADLVVFTPSEELNPYYLSAIFNSAWGKANVAGKLVGVAQQHFNVTVAKEMLIMLPLRNLQDKVAGILTAYDDLIENNLRRIKILEEMARSLYREWFVNFRFPGHEKIPLVDSPLGKIPKGWEVASFYDLLESGLGGDWGLDEPDAKENAPVFVIRGTDFDDILNGTTLRIPRRFIMPSSLDKRQLQAGDLLVENSINAKSRCVGTTLFITNGILRRLSDPAIAASFCKVYRFKDPSLAPLAHLHMRYLYGEGRMAFYQNVAANGIGNFQSQRFLDSEYLVFPTNSQIRQKIFGFLKDLTSSTLADQIFKLRSTRDLLLPKLISGELDVSELGIAMSENEKV